LRNVPAAGAPNAQEGPGRDPAEADFETCPASED